MRFVWVLWVIILALALCEAALLGFPVSRFFSWHAVYWTGWN